MIETAINSDAIWVYPAETRDGAYAGGYAYLGKTNFESNITNQLTNIVDYTNYSISQGTRLRIQSNQLIINPCRYILNGYFIDIKNAISIPLTEFILESSYWVYLRLNTKNTTITLDGISITETELDGTDDPNINKYTGVEIFISSGFPLDTETEHNFVLGVIKYSQSTGWSLITNNNIQNKTNAEHTTITVGSELAEISNYVGTKNFKSWLNNNFIIDDGEII